ncbi:GxxExxY protein [Oryzomonas rubra]|uniref:GxxExxY protein n=1 Tax=Oryzomonas rubra TaxID=2509454 RepID=A0A5A9XPR8_9BACT|nr:GxxExxY protein [Oryzomonas rubra]
MCRGDTEEAINGLTDKIIGCAIEVHRNLGPGLLEGIYEKALCHELQSSGLRFQCQAIIPIIYKGTRLGDHRLDLLVEDEIIIELKAVEKIESVFKAQLLSYLKLTNKKLGLLINFNVPVLKDGVTRIIL